MGDARSPFDAPSPVLASSRTSARASARARALAATIARVRRSSVLLAAAALLLVGAAAVWMFWPRVALPAELLRAVPADAYGVARVRVDRVLASEAYKRLVV